MAGTGALPTTLEENQRLADLLDVSVTFKREDRQICRSYKVRGAFNLMPSLTESERRRGVVCAGVGNHGQGVAFSCRRLGIRVRVFVPANTLRHALVSATTVRASPSPVAGLASACGCSSLPSPSARSVNALWPWKLWQRRRQRHTRCQPH
ncbi:hypothetical protein GCM10022214_17100 [Actinomadura miaoliensis]|uniref:Tryptophan synthase beta chain-like PALP domain-containing protein n=1 Tax=Actinomadura miaoliensis TaxID=430685 RepID=A0ABP7VBY3_9ACTN